MFCPWNLCFVLSISLPLSQSHDRSGEGDEKTPKYGPDKVDSLGLALSWPSSSYEQLDRQGVIGEYDDLQESTETTAFYLEDKALIPSKAAGSSTDEDGRLTTTLEQHVSSYESADIKSGPFLLSAQTSEDHSAYPAVQSETDDFGRQHFSLSDSPGQVFTGESREDTSPVVTAGHLGRTADPLLNSQSQDTLTQTEDTRESFHLGNVSRLEDTGEIHT